MNAIILLDITNFCEYYTHILSSIMVKMNATMTYHGPNLDNKYFFNATSSPWLISKYIAEFAKESN